MANPRKHVWVGIAEVLALTGVHSMTIYRYMRREDDPFPAAHYHFGKLRWKQAEVDEWLERQPTTSDPAARRAHTNAPVRETDKREEAAKAAA